MALFFGDRTCMVEARLVEKHTFLVLEPQGISPEARENCDCGRRRSKSDSFLEYSPIQSAGKDVELAPSSLGDCETMSLSSSQLLSEDFEDSSAEMSSNSSNAEIEGDSCVQETKTCVAASPPQQHIIVQRDATSQGESVYHYSALPNSHPWGQFPVTCFPAEISPQPANAMLQVAELEAQVAQLELEAARLRVAAQQVVTGTVPATVMPIDCCPAWNCCTSQICQASVPSQAVTAAHQEELTTIMLRNIPNDYTRAMLLDLLDSLDLAGRYNFVYLPIDFQRISSLGYAFVNLVEHDDAEKAFRGLQAFKNWKVSSQKVCEVCWSEPLQGLSAYVERYRSSPVMHNDMPDHMKPIVLQDGIRVPFPLPSKRVRPPRTIRASIRMAK